MLLLILMLSLLCAAGCQVTLLAQPGQNVSLPCNVTSGEVVWLRLSSDRLLPLLTVRQSRLPENEDTVNVLHADRRRVSIAGQVSSGVVSLLIRDVQQGDGGLYSCFGRCSGISCEHTEVQLALQGDDGPSEAFGRPCLTVGVCVLPAVIVFGCLVCVGGAYLYSGKAGVCCPSCSLQDLQEETHYSSLKLPDKPRPSGRPAAQLAEQSVTYSTVANHKTRTTSENAFYKHTHQETRRM